MSENIIYCYSGSGNCLDMAKNIAKGLGDTDIVLMRKAPVTTDATSYKRVGFVFPCYGGGLPGDVEKYVKGLKLSRESYKFGVVQYAGYMGCGLYKIDKIVGLDYWDKISQHCSCIWLMPHNLTLPPVSVEKSQKRSEKASARVALAAKQMKKSEKKPPKNAVNAAESAAFGNLNKLINKKMSVNSNCIGCATCVNLCPRENIQIVGGKACIGSNCIGCMSCVEYCPKEAINVGKVTIKRERYHNKNISARDLTESIIHID